MLEFVSECAGLRELADLERLVGDRLRWLFDFDSCVLFVRGSDRVRCLSMRSTDAGLSERAEIDVDDTSRLAHRSMASGYPETFRRDLHVIAYPLGPSARPFGAISIGSAQAYVQRDFRFLHHVCTAVGAVLDRLHQENDARSRERDAERARTTRDEALAESHAKDSFLAMLGHELRNPLAPIIATAELLRRETSGSTLERARIIERQARQLDRLVGDLLEVSRVSNGKILLRRSPLDLRDVVSKSAEMAQPLVEAKQQRFAIARPDAAVVVSGDEARLAQVLSNLLNNASNYSAVGSLIEVTLETLDGEAHVVVRDEGIGIASGMLGSIFGMFVQGGRSLQASPGGLGLGLGVARALLEMHGGRIWAESEGEDRGSRFHLALPLSSDSPVDAVDACDAIVESGAVATLPLRVLLVDDNADAADSMAELLRAAGHDVVVAYAPDQALEATTRFSPQDAILDIGLPIMSGHELGAALRQRLGAAAPRLVALSGYGQEKDRETSLQSGFAAHLAKPASLADLLQAMRPGD